MKPTPTQRRLEKTQRSNQYRREVQPFIASPTRQGWYIEARLYGKTIEQALAIARRPEMKRQERKV